MLERYIKLFKGGAAASKKPGEEPSPAPVPASPPPASLGSAIPLLEPILPATDNELIDTGHFTANSVVARVPEIQTDGPRTNVEKLRQKIIGRQPLLDRSQHIIGYELLLRSKALLTAKEPDAALLRMQDEALIRCLADLHLERLLEDKLAFVAISPDMLRSRLLLNLPSKGIVLMVRHDPARVEDNLLRCSELRGLGYQIALDDFEPKQGLGPFLALASFVRVDVSKFNAIELGKLADRFQDKPVPQLIAKNVETEDDFKACHKMRFHCYEGNYFTRLRPSSPPCVDSNRIRVLELLDMARNQVEVSLLEEGFRHDAVLAYKLLRYINAPVNGLQQQIRSIAHALMILGYKQLYRWLTLLLFTSGTQDARSRALLQNALVRARMTELLGLERLPPAEQEGLFIVGIFSLLDALLNVPMAEALGQIKLPEPVVAALVRREGIYAPFLSLAVACEEADQEAIVQHAATCGLTADEVNIAQVKALIWAEELDR